MIRAACQYAWPALCLVVPLASTAPVKAEGENLQIVIRTGSDLSQPKIERVLKMALGEMTTKAQFSGKSIIDGELMVKSISATDYNAYKRLAYPDEKLPELPVVKSEGLELRQLPAATPTWEFNLLGDKAQELVKLEVVYDDAALKPVTLLPTTKRGDVLTMSQFGSYVLNPAADKKPMTYTAHIRTLGEKDIRQVTGKWPESHNYYLIRLNGFKGELQALSDMIKNSEKIPGALDSFDIKPDVTLALGEARSGEDIAEDVEFDGNKLFINVPKLRNGKPKRAFLLFPLTERQFDAQLAILRGLPEDKVPAHIRMNVVEANVDAIVTPTSTFKWYEMPLVEPGEKTRLKVGSFGRVITLVSSEAKAVKPEDYRKLKENFPQAYQIVVYEFDNGKYREALPYKRTKNDVKQYIANGGLMTFWPTKLDELAGDQPKPKEDKK